MSDLKIKLEPWQDDFMFTPAKFRSMVSGWGTGKTEIGILLGMVLSDESPNNLGLICRREFVDLRDSTMRDFEKYTGIKINSDKDAILPNGSVIMFRHAEELDVLKNTNLGWFLMEQSEEFKSDKQFVFLMGRARRDNAKRRIGMVIANTKGHNWIWKWFKQNKNKDPRFFLAEATTYDNTKHLKPDYIDSLAIIKEKTPEVYNRFVMNSWEEEDTETLIIPESIIRPCIDLSPLYKDNRRLISGDPAGEGKDRGVIMGFMGTRVVGRNIYRQEKPMVYCGYLREKRVGIDGQLIVIDAIGIGAGIADRLREEGENYYGIISSEKSTNPLRFANLKTEIWWYVREMFEAKRINMIDDPELITELSSVHYTIDSKGLIKLEKKDDIIEELGHSPDLADCFTNGIYGLQFVKDTEKRFDTYRKPRGKKIGSAMSM